MVDEAQRWDRVKQLFQDALERPADERGIFVRAACGDDRELQSEVESLLVAHAAAGSFAQGPAIEALPSSAADAFANPVDNPSGDNPSVPRHIGSYQVLSFLGAGGMGEVYRARDPRLGREVAIKILPETFARDPEREARLEREAKILAALNHPHIAQVYGFEQAHSSGSGERTANALVMELVEGDTLTHVLEQGSLPVKVDATSNGEFRPVPLTEPMSRANSEAERRIGDHAKHVEIGVLAWLNIPSPYWC